MGIVSRPERRPADDSADTALVRRIRTGDRGAVDDLYDRFLRPAYALARRVLGDDALAEDVLHDVFLSAALLATLAVAVIFLMKEVPLRSHTVAREAAARTSSAGTAPGAELAVE